MELARHLAFEGTQGASKPISTETALEATHGQMEGFISQFPRKCHLEEVASVGD